MRTMLEIKQANRDAGHFFFSPETMRAYGCRTHEGTFPGAEGTTLFSFNNTNPDSHAPGYYIGRSRLDGSVWSADGGDAYLSYSAVRKAVAELSARETSLAEVAS